MPYKNRQDRVANNRAYHQRPEIKERRRAQRAANPRAKMVARRWSLGRRYGLSSEDYFGMLQRQNGVCGICRQPNTGKRDWHIDHDHGNGRVRGVLCNPCNLMIGLAKDDPDTLRAGAKYLDDYVVREYATDYT
jgi:hypothetical protein